MAVDVKTRIEINRACEIVAAYTSNPDNAPEWYVNIKSIEWRTKPPLRLGSQCAFVAHFLGRRLAYVYEVVDYEPNRRLVMRTADGPFPMETTYIFQAVNPERTRVELQNRGVPTGFSKLASPLMSGAIKRANNKDLATLKKVIESVSPNGR